MLGLDLDARLEERAPVVRAEAAPRLAVGVEGAADAIHSAARLCDAEMLSFSDALTIVSAARSGFELLYTEDLADGRVFQGAQVVDPLVQTTSK